MEAAMYADLFAWRITLIIVLLFAVPYVIYELRRKDEKPQEENPDTCCPCCCPCRGKTCQAFDEKSD